MANHAAQLVAHNELGGQVEVLQSRAEEVELTEKVDLIISEWMGTLLLVGMHGFMPTGWLSVIIVQHRALFVDKADDCNKG